LGLGKALCEALETVSVNRAHGAVVLFAALPNSEATKLDNGMTFTRERRGTS